MTTADNGSRINLIMSGGGVRLSTYVGALAAFRDMGVSVGAVAGASAGGIVGALLAAGWPVDRTYGKLLETNFAEFKDLTLMGLLFEPSATSTSPPRTPPAPVPGDHAVVREKRPDQ